MPQAEAIKQLAQKYNVSEKQIQTDIIYLRMCFIFAEQSKAKRLKVGEFVLTRQGIIVPGYNGTAPGTSNECEYVDPNTGNLVSYNHIICGLQNGIYKAAREGIPLVDGTGYSTDSPCPRCGPAAISVNLKRFVYCRQYRIIDHLPIMEEQGIQICHIPYEIVFPEKGSQECSTPNIKKSLRQTWQSMWKQKLMKLLKKMRS